MKNDKMTQIHLVLIGDELLSGRIDDVNGHWLGQYLTGQHNELKSIQTVPDSVTAINDTLYRLWEQNPEQRSLIILSGGLGPTRDDLTKQAVSHFIDSALVVNSQLEETMAKRYREYGKEWDPQSNGYHLFPSDCHPVENRKGLAPGIYYREKNRHLLCAPGVPIEFQSMVEDFFEKTPELLIAQGQQTKGLNGTVTVRTRYIPEEEIFSKLCPGLWDELESWGKVSSLPQPLGVDILIKTQSETSTGLKKIRNQLAEYLKTTPLSPYIWHIGEESLFEKIILEAREKKIQIGLAESCTGGLAASYLTDIAGCSEVFQGSVVSYANNVKQELLNVSEEDIEKHGAVSREVAAAMAEGARNSLQADITVSFSGIAGPKGGSTRKPVGTVAIGVSSEQETLSSFYYFKGNRARLKRRFALQGLHLLLDAIRNY